MKKGQKNQTGIRNSNFHLEPSIYANFTSLHGP